MPEGRQVFAALFFYLRQRLIRAFISFEFKYIHIIIRLYYHICPSLSAVDLRLNKLSKQHKCNVYGILKGLLHRPFVCGIGQPCKQSCEAVPEAVRISVFYITPEISHSKGVNGQ